MTQTISLAQGQIDIAKIWCSLYFMDFVRFPWYCDRMCSPHFFFQFARTSIIQHGHAPQHFVPVSSTGISFWLKSAACEAVDPLLRSPTLSIFIFFFRKHFETASKTLPQADAINLLPKRRW